LFILATQKKATEKILHDFKKLLVNQPSATSKIIMIMNPDIAPNTP
jgi:hypothetical protein